MLEIVSQITLVTLGVALLVAFIRLVKGPTLPDRIVAMDLFGMLVVGLIVVLAGSSGVRATLDAAIVIALIGFLGTVAYATYVETRRSTMTDIVTAIVWLAGSAFALLAAVGVLRMPDVFTRMQASTKASTLGLACLLIGAALQMGDFASFIRVASIGAFVLLTTPVAGHVIARASYFAGVPLWEGTVLDERARPTPRAGLQHETESSGIGGLGSKCDSRLSEAGSVDIISTPGGHRGCERRRFWGRRSWPLTP